MIPGAQQKCVILLMSVLLQGEGKIAFSLIIS